MRLPCVWQKCNNTWMSGMETTVKKIMGPMIEDLSLPQASTDSCYKPRTWVDLLDLTSMAKGCCQLDSGARHERIATSVSPSRSRHKSFGCYEMCACTVKAFIETASPANFRCGGAYGSIECRVPHISAPVGDAGIRRECAR